LIKKIIKETDEDMNKEYEKIKLENSLMQELGTKTYLDIIKGQKNAIFSKILEDKHIKITSPDDNWYKDNIENLKDIKGIFKSSKSEISWLDGNVSSFDERIEYLIKKCENKEYIGFIEENENKKVWSLLNKIDTNYSNWDSMIKDRLLRKDGGIDDVNKTNVIHKYFKQRPLSDVLHPNRLINFREYEKNLINKINTISYAEYDLLNAFAKKNSEKLESIFEKIKFTTNLGDKLESKFLTHLRNSKKPSLKIIDFSTPGSIVDTVFGIDCIIYFDGIWYAIQVKGGESGKNRAKNAFVHNLGINSLSIYETNNDFYYYTPSNKNSGNNFKKDFGI
jgi:hypothetical protein